jgi:hypothetical protein
LHARAANIAGFFSDTVSEHENEKMPLDAAFFMEQRK